MRIAYRREKIWHLIRQVVKEADSELVRYWAKDIDKNYTFSYRTAAEWNQGRSMGRETAVNSLKRQVISAKPP